MDYQLFPHDSAAGESISEPWGSITWLASDKIGNASCLTLGRVVIRPGFSNPRHAHDTCEEALYLIAGSLEHSVGRQTVTLNPGDTLVVPAGIFHNALSVGDTNADMIVAYSSAKRDFKPES